MAPDRSYKRARPGIGDAWIVFAGYIKDNEVIAATPDPPPASTPERDADSHAEADVWSTAGEADAQP